MIWFTLPFYACFPVIESVEEERFPENPEYDYDQDGYYDATDCDDADPSVTLPQWYYNDADNDGFGVESDAEYVCPAEKSEGYIEAKYRNNTIQFDCDDSNLNVHPDAVEICDLLDNNCNEVIDMDVEVDAPIWYLDSDGDDYGDFEVQLSACPNERNEGPPGYVNNFADCNDDDPNIFPNATEYCNDLDDNCNGVVDEPSANGASLWYRDEDADGFGNFGNSTPSCNQPDGFVSNSQDCNDSNAEINPNSSEICNNEDDDCNGLVDEGADTTAPTGSVTYYRDFDQDGYGDANNTITQCILPTNYVLNDEDCDDSNSDVYPNAIEFCNETDDNCNGEIDESTAVDPTTFYLDMDGDGYGNTSNFEFACPYNQPPNTVTTLGDCSPTDATIHPGATELCNEIDDNCDGNVDEGVGINAPPNSDTWYYDLDGDGFGNALNTILACTPPIGTVSNMDDCNDTNANVHLGADEYCNGIDDDCDGELDESAVDMTSYYLDNDLDGHGDPTTIVSFCPVLENNQFVPPTGSSLYGDDCDDQDPNISPSANELCTESIDENCDGLMTYGVLLEDLPSWYPDSDGDGYGNPNFVIQLCQQPQNYVDNPDDCNDTDYYVHPLNQGIHANDTEEDGVTPYVHRERCNGKVDICENDIYGDLTPPDIERDLDNDAYVECDLDVDILQWADQTLNILGGSDCNDADPLSYPGALEVCNGIFDNCTHPQINLFSAPLEELDNDGDTFVECSGFDSQTWVGQSTVVGGDDCNDSSIYTHPGAAYLTDSTACLTDVDQDGVADRSWTVCPQLNPIESGRFKIGSYQSGVRAGLGIFSAGDVDGDGLDELITGSLYGDGLYMFLGSSLSQDGDIDINDADYIFTPESSGAFHSVASAGDVDGDGLGDILFGLSTNGENGFNAGKVYLFLGSSLGGNQTIPMTDATTQFLGESTFDYLGHAIASAGDVDGDGLDDIMMGAYQNETGGNNSGSTYLFLGSTLPFNVSISVSEADYILVGENESDFFGIAIDGGSDFDGDGYDDVLVSSTSHNTQTGAVYLVSSSLLGLSQVISLSDASIKIYGEDNYNAFGMSAKFAPDIDGDDMPDVVVGAPFYGANNSRYGRGYIFFNSSLSATMQAGNANYIFEGEASLDYFGDNVSVGDLDGNGLTDIYWSAQGNDFGDESSGSAYLTMAQDLTQPGQYSAANTSFQIYGSDPYLSTGQYGTISGDYDGDGMNETVTGSYFHDYFSNGGGLISVFSGCEN